MALERSRRKHAAAFERESDVFFRTGRVCHNALSDTTISRRGRFRQEPDCGADPRYPGENALIYRRFARPVLFRLNPEYAHHEAIRMSELLNRSRIARRILRGMYSRQYPELEVELFGLKFRNPVGLSAGFDKHGQAYPILGDLGFGHIEIGSVSLRPWRGNPSPTLLRLPPDGALINRFGLNSEGADAVCRRLDRYPFEVTTGINLVKTADPAICGADAIDDYVQAFERLHERADFVTLNLSCPNSSDGRTFQDPLLLEPLLKKIREIQLQSARPNTPVLVKVSPDLNERILGDLLGVAQRNGVSGVVVANTTERRERLKTPAVVLDRFGFGGLSGRPLKPLVRNMIRTVRRLTSGQLPIVACGGVGCDPMVGPAEEVWDYLRAGASLVQLYTGLIYRGPAICREINTGLIRILRRHNIRNLGALLEIP
jgi:dihydroorotate dehydrogenase